MIRLDKIKILREELLRESIFLPSGTTVGDLERLYEALLKLNRTDLYRRLGFSLSDTITSIQALLYLLGREPKFEYAAVYRGKNV